MTTSESSQLITLARNSTGTTPYVIYDTALLHSNCKDFKTLFKPHPIFFSVKANSTPSILRIVKDEELNFDVASWEEVKILKSINVPAKRIIFSAPTKIPSDIKRAYAYGIRVFAFDSKEELDKLAKLAPNSEVFARLAVDNEGSEWPLVRKFGLTNEEALEYIPYATKLGLNPIGFTFHVGSQNVKPSTWTRALERVYSVWIEFKLKNIDLPIINIGGGFPVYYHKDVPSLKKIADEIKSSTEKLFDKHVSLNIEPGRRLVGNTGLLVTTVVNRAQRDGDEWLYLDVGVFSGLQETLEGFRYPVVPENKYPKNRNKMFVLCGPTCDSVDTLMKDVSLPRDIKVGDRLFILSAGAYITSMEHYNGFKYPKSVIP